MSQRAIINAVLAGLCAVAFTGGAASAATSKDEDAIKARVADFIALFNKGDAKGLSQFFGEDATLVNPIGQRGTGRAEIEKVIAADVSTFLKDTKMEMTVTQFHPVGKDAAWIEIDHSVSGAKSPDGKPLPTMTFHVPCLMMKKGKTWLIEEARPYAYLPPPPKPAAMATASPKK